MFFCDKEDLILRGILLLVFAGVIFGFSLMLGVTETTDGTSTSIAQLQEGIVGLFRTFAIGLGMFGAIMLIPGVIMYLIDWRDEKLANAEVEKNSPHPIEGIIAKVSGKDLSERVRFIGKGLDGKQIDEVFYPRTDNIEIELCDGNKNPSDDGYDTPDIKDKNMFYGKLWVHSAAARTEFTKIEYLRPLELTK